MYLKGIQWLLGNGSSHDNGELHDLEFAWISWIEAWLEGGGDKYSHVHVKTIVNQNNVKYFNYSWYIKKNWFEM